MHKSLWLRPLEFHRSPYFCDYTPGQMIPSSGAYEIRHANGKKESVLFLHLGQFPKCAKPGTKLCDGCGEQVRFSLVRAAPHISEDEDFAFPLD